MEAWIDYLAIGLANLVTVLTPDRIVLGGGVASASGRIIAPLRERLEAHVHLTDPDHVEIVHAALGVRAGAIGAALRGLEPIGCAGPTGGTGVPQAVVVREFGGPESMVVEHRAELVPGPGEVVVDLRAAALNRRDLRVIAGGWPGVTVPLVPGSDGAGVVRALGCGVSGFAEGDEVLCCPRSTGATIRACSGRTSASSAGPTTARSPSRCACRRPTSSRSRPAWFEQAAALPLAGLTAWRALFTRGGLQSGQSVLVLGAGAGTSTFAVQFARAAGARVFVTSSSAEKIARALELGAEAGFDYTEDGWEQAVVERSGGGVDLVMDSAGTWQSSVACVRAGGRVVVFGGTAGTTAELDVRGFYFKQIDVVGTMMGSPVDFRALLRACELQTWTPIVDSERPLAEAGDALRRRRRASSSASSC